MKIALTVKGAGLGAWLDDDFAHCNIVMVVDDDTQIESWENTYKNAENEDLFQFADAIIGEEVDVVVTGQISQLILDYFVDAGVKVVVKNGGTVFTLIEEIQDNN